MKQQVIIITYNQCDHLNSCLESIFANTVLPWRVSVFDDASVDKTEFIIRRYIELYPDMIHYHKNADNLGIFGNIDVAKKSAEGEVIHLIGGDDYFDVKFFEEIEKCYHKNEGSLVGRNFHICSSFDYVYENGECRTERSSIIKEDYKFNVDDILMNRIHHRNLGLGLDYFRLMPDADDGDYLWMDLYYHLEHCLQLDVLIGCPGAKSFFRQGSGVTSKSLKSNLYCSKIFALSKFFLDFGVLFSKKIRLYFIFLIIVSSFKMFAHFVIEFASSTSVSR